jgi:hypothetical protein
VKKLVSLLASLGVLAGCSALLPKSKETAGDATNTWQSYRDAEQAFDRIVPGKTTMDELRALRFDPRANPSITPMPRYEIMQLFMVNKTVTMDDLDSGVRDCLAAQAGCSGWRIDQTASQKKRTGNAALDIMRLRRETQTSGWRFTGLLLVKDGVVLYKLSGGQPHIHEIAETEDALGPLSAIGNKLNGINGINVTAVRNGIASSGGGGGGGDGHVQAVTAVGVRR